MNQRTTTNFFDTKIEFLKGVGPQRAEQSQGPGESRRGGGGGANGAESPPRPQMVKQRCAGHVGGVGGNPPCFGGGLDGGATPRPL